MHTCYTFTTCIFEHIGNKGHHGNVQYFILSVFSSCESMASFITSPSCWVYLPSESWSRNLHSGGKASPALLAQAEQTTAYEKQLPPHEPVALTPVRTITFCSILPVWPRTTAHSCHAIPLQLRLIVDDITFHWTLHKGSHQARAASQPAQLA